MAFTQLSTCHLISFGQLLTEWAKMMDTKQRGETTDRMYTISLMTDEPTAESEVSEQMQALSLKEVDEYLNIFQTTESPLVILHTNRIDKINDGR